MRKKGKMIEGIIKIAGKEQSFSADHAQGRLTDLYLYIAGSDKRKRFQFESDYDKGMANANRYFTTGYIVGGKSSIEVQIRFK